MLGLDLTKQLENKTLFISGATGLIGSNIIKTLLSETIKDFKIIALVRNIEKANKVFGKFLPTSRLQFVVGDICSLPEVSSNIDFIIHAANETSSRAFVQNPIRVSTTALNGTLQMLDLAKEKGVESFIYLSSMEVYGAPTTDEKIDETHSTNINVMSVRSCYPESKRMCESLCKSYTCEFGVPTKVVRLTQTFGKGVDYNDGRVFAEFARCAVENRDIVLHTKGDTKRNYLSTDDATNAILTVMLKGKNGEAYNAANEETYCSILEMAQMVATDIANNKIKVVIELNDDPSFGYAPTLHMNLDTAKLRALGWNANFNLKEMYEKMIDDWRAKLV